MSWRLTSLGALAGIGALAAGCGGAGGGPAPASTLPPARASSGARAVAIRSTDPPPGGSVSKARLAAFARAVNLTAADVPGSSASSTRPKRPANEPTRCGGVSAAHQLGDVKSPKLIRGTGLEREEIRSAVSLMSSPATATADIASAHSAAGLACYSRILRDRFAGKSVSGSRVSNVSLSPLPVAARGTDASVGVRIAVSITPAHSETSIPIYFDVLAFTLGPVEINLQASSAVQPEPSTTETQLLSLLVRRAEAHTL